MRRQTDGICTPEGFDQFSTTVAQGGNASFSEEIKTTRQIASLFFSFFFTVKSLEHQ